MRDKSRITEIKETLLEHLKKEHVFWSYDNNEISIETLTDDALIAYSLRYLDLSEINLLFSIFPKTKIKRIWVSRLIPEGEYLYTLNRFFAWYYFNAKRPGQYIKSLHTRHLNRMIS